MNGTNLFNNRNRKAHTAVGMLYHYSPGLFFCGELINVDGVTGGFNFMNCWATGYLAGCSSAEYCIRQQQQQPQQ
eukprot:scaffold1736_cov127-Cylindrotheca_fusiformis.AAC.8